MREGLLTCVTCVPCDGCHFGRLKMFQGMSISQQCACQVMNQPRFRPRRALIFPRTVTFKPFPSQAVPLSSNESAKTGAGRAWQDGYSWVIVIV